MWPDQQGTLEGAIPSAQGWAAPAAPGLGLGVAVGFYPRFPVGKDTAGGGNWRNLEQLLRLEEGRVGWGESEGLLNPLSARLRNPPSIF